MGGLLPYLARVDLAAEPLVRAEDWVRAAREVTFDAYNEGLDVLELRFSPWFVSRQSGLAPEAVIDAVTEGALRHALKSGSAWVSSGSCCAISARKPPMRSWTRS